MGKEPKFGTFPVQRFSGDGSTTSFTLTEVPATNTSLLVTISGVKQQTSAYSVTDTALDFGGGNAPPSGTNNIEVVYMGQRSLVASIADDTITNAKINSSAAIAASKLGTGVGKIATAATWTAAQRGEITALTSAATITIDMADSNNFSVTLAHNATFANPSNDTAGQSGSIFITQDGTGSRTASWGTDWEFAGGTAPTLTTTAAASDRIDYVIRSGTSIQAVATLALA